MMLRAVCVVFRTGPDTVVLNPSEPSKEKEKQGFFRAIKKKKKKSQMVTCTCFSNSVSWTCPSMSVCISSTALKMLSALAYRAHVQKYKVVPCVCPVHRVSLCHQSPSSLLQVQVPEGRPPVIKKSLFPLFSPKNSIKHSSSVRVLPVVSSPMVPVVLHSPPNASPPVSHGMH